MRRVKDFIPRSEKEFKQWSDNFMTKLGEIVTKYLMPIATYRELVRIWSDYNKKYKLSETAETRTSATVCARREARTVYEKKLRLVIKSYITYNPAVSDDQRRLLGLPIHKTTKTPIGIPTEHPSMKIKVMSDCQLAVLFHEDRHESKDDRGSRAKPYGMDGASIIYDVLPEPPTEYSQLTRRAIATRTPFIINFSLPERGKTAYFAIAWINEKGQIGPYSSIISAIIP
ncbi:MAG: hypothetical protein LBF79_05780 [Dysgonamonadaceae bacterium]|nr:hypothetical protein [Dysgonamonadaceae bacterium]